MKPDQPSSSGRRDRNSPPPIPGPVLALILALLAVAVVLGYLLVNKLADISRDDDCILAHRKNCAAIEMSSVSSLA
ncbi:MAG: hypothetical protein JO141_13090 [Bradyrhizobium sp.]|nr:hypothetical protein [Bradyrhizobium sp.]